MIGVAWGWPHEGQAGPSSQQEDGEMLVMGCHGTQLRCTARPQLPREMLFAGGLHPCRLLPSGDPL